MVGKEPFFSLLTAPSTWTDLSKESGKKWFEQTTKRPSGLKCAQCVPTKPFHFARRVLLIGDFWTKLPADISETLLRPCTTKHREGIPLQETHKRKLGNNSFAFYSFFPAEPEQQLSLGVPTVKRAVSQVCLDFDEPLTSLPFSTQFLLCAEFCSSNNHGRFDCEYTG